MRALLLGLLLLATPAIASPREEATAIVVDAATLDSCASFGIEVPREKAMLIAAVTAYSRRHGVDVEEVMAEMYGPYYYYVLKQRVVELMKNMGPHQLEMVCKGAVLDLKSRAAN